VAAVGRPKGQIGINIEVLKGPQEFKSDGTLDTRHFGESTAGYRKAFAANVLRILYFYILRATYSSPYLRLSPRPEILSSVHYLLLNIIYIGEGRDNFAPIELECSYLKYEYWLAAYGGQMFARLKIAMLPRSRL